MRRLPCLAYRSITVPATCAIGRSRRRPSHRLAGTIRGMARPPGISPTADNSSERGGWDRSGRCSHAAHGAQTSHRLAGRMSTRAGDDWRKGCAGAADAAQCTSEKGCSRSKPVAGEDPAHWICTKGPSAGGSPQGTGVSAARLPNAYTCTARNQKFAGSAGPMPRRPMPSMPRGRRPDAGGGPREECGHRAATAATGTGVGVADIRG